MKKFFAFIFMLAVGWGNLAAGDPVDMNTAGNHTPGYPGNPKAPVLVPTASIDGYTFYIDGYHTDYTLVLIDENDTVVYTTFFPSTLSEIELPSTLSGNFELRLYPGGDYYFYGYISL